MIKTITDSLSYELAKNDANKCFQDPLHILYEKLELAPTLTDIDLASSNQICIASMLIIGFYRENYLNKLDFLKQSMKQFLQKFIKYHQYAWKAHYRGKKYTNNNDGLQLTLDALYCLLDPDVSQAYRYWRSKNTFYAWVRGVESLILLLEYMIKAGTK
ncbi:hypothetical protein KGF56_002529 [Candida oxycetoniae]|uniref:Uncharacterized protein n=1 Tax=Candida oxycetoniae TaxID=497107 RepID=A0AAI9WY61_9ASCO|nr:uncharacterized protein KGF56_002529 [Candida oxycetoniae]KAI3404695.1 hypothetical protein KGF56_002529 [Candida oxycetoniae]